MKAIFRPALVAISGWALYGACSDLPDAPRAPLSVSIAALTLPGADNVCYDLLVENGVAGPTTRVWSKGDPLLTLLGADQTGATATPGALDTATICSRQYGNLAGGDITYVGTCDASTDSDPAAAGNQNRVTLWVDGVYGADGADIGEWQDPCPDGCSLSVDCNENEDSLVEFNVTIMRQANQGFFDIAVNFEDIFCSAKFDTCYPAGAPGASDDDHIELLHGGDPNRDWTGVFGFACTAGTDATATNLLYGPVEVTCGTEVLTIDPTVAEGNASVTAGTPAKTLHYGVYRGAEQLTCGAGSCNKLYWNLALSLEDLASFGGTCTLSLSATANDAGEGFTAGLPTAIGLTWPYIEIDALTLTADGVASCQQNPLNGQGSAVQTRYKGNVEGVPEPVAMCAAWDGTSATSTEGCPTCSDGEQNGDELGVDCGGACGAPMPTLLWTHDWGTLGNGTVSSGDLGGIAHEVVVTTQGGPTGLTYDRAANYIYFSENYTGSILRAVGDGAGVTTLVTGPTGSGARGLAVDTAGGHLYWLASTWPTGRLMRSDLDGGNPTQLGALTTGRGPYGLALDLVHGHIFYSDGNVAQIFRRDLDGSNEVLFVDRFESMGLAVDPVGGYLYISVNSDYGVAPVCALRRISLDGSNMTCLVENTPGRYGWRGILIDVPNDTLYLGNNGSGRFPNEGVIYRARLDGSEFAPLFTGLTGVDQISFGPLDCP